MATEKTKQVQYIGTSDVRIIGRAIWNAENKFTVPYEDLSQEAQKYADENSQEFKVS